MSRTLVLRLVASAGETGIDLSGRQMPGIDLSSDAIRAEMGRIGHPYERPPMWYSPSTGGVNLAGASFAAANLERALLWRGNLTGAVFRKANLRKADLGVSVLVDADLAGADLEGAILARADLDGADLSGANLANADLRDVDLTQVKSLDGIYLSGANLGNTAIRREQLARGIGEERDKDYYGAKEAYLALKNNFFSLGRYDDASWALIKERQMEKKSNNPFRAKRFYGQFELAQPARLLTGEGLMFVARHTLRWALDWLNELLCGYGEKPLRVVFWALVTVLVFPLLYHASQGITATTEMPLTWLDYFQYSLAAFSALSLPDVIATSQWAKLLTSLEALLGISMLALLMFALGNRIGRSQ